MHSLKKYDPNSTSRNIEFLNISTSFHSIHRKYSKDRIIELWSLHVCSGTKGHKKAMKLQEITKVSRKALKLHGNY